MATGAGARVALRKESVDRNRCVQEELYKRDGVALRKESVDRNVQIARDFGPLHVALRKESVDRNRYAAGSCWQWLRSLSARRAWIEISTPWPKAQCPWSLSARRAWIEIAR